MVIKMTNFLICWILLSIQVCYSTTLRNEVYPDYIVVVDAGSSGSRANLFHVIKAENGEATEIKQMNQIETTPGISSFEKNPQDAWTSIYPILKETESLIDDDYVYQTPIYILATAGMRVLSKKSQKTIYSHLYLSYLKSDIKMYLDDTQLMTIDGEDEALYGWITVNVLKNTITPSFTLKGPSATYASVDLGGESTQIAFKKPSKYEKEGMKIDINKDIYKKSYLFFGAKESMNRYELYISMKYKTSNRTVESPCFNKNYKGSHILLEDVTFIGTGDFDKCVEILEYLTQGDSKCESDFCSLWSDSIIPFSGNYIGMSMYFYTLDALHSYIPSFSFPDTHLSDIYKVGKDFCKLEMTDVIKNFDGKHKFTPQSSLVQRCFHTAWIYSLLKYGYHITDNTTLFAGKEINNTPIDWSYGAAVYMAQKPVPIRSSKAPYYLILAAIFICVLLFIVSRKRGVQYKKIQKNMID